MRRWAVLWLTASVSQRCLAPGDCVEAGRNPHGGSEQGKDTVLDNSDHEILKARLACTREQAKIAAIFVACQRERLAKARGGADRRVAECSLELMEEILSLWQGEEAHLQGALHRMTLRP